MAKKSVEVQVFDSDFALLLRESVTYEIKMESRPKSKFRTFVFVCILLAVTGIVYFGYFCPDQVCALSSRETAWSEWTFRTPIQDNLGKPLQTHSEPLSSKLSNPGLSYDDVLNENFQFDMKAHDVMVFLHIQKTGGTSFGRHLVRDLDLERPCTCQRKRKRCYCFRPNRKEIWLFSRYSTGWKCGLHADWTELTSCVDSELDKNEGDKVKRRYFYITLLREPISRYLSEFRHVQRGATWRNSRHWCGGHVATREELPLCYKGDSWKGVTLDQFAACPYNLAANRQTRMLADLALVGCYNMSYMSPVERDRVMLASAKKNLASMAFFGLTEYQKIAQYVFEETFNLRFAVPFEQHNATVSSVTLSMIRQDQLETIRRLNDLDLELYSFAKALMFQRFDRLKSKDPLFKERFAHLGELPGRQSDSFDWDQVIYDDNNITQK
ncbi:heparan-sulfate 6-O-sulfotransferase 2 [Schistocerca piceifrons]|uniref:heparan-sulfate 6-O-sulfotransferase 2 n=1 Tax=Schistocerca piceifrons TaxID=274613 RepID=UPI001F5FDCDB|nr:heparan-sulfate 6-O-sulfotransferase 2 [Schistocerca piceifrons]